MRNLIKRGNVYHVTKDVPKALRAIAGVPRLQDTLNTTDLAVADRSKHSFLAGYERRLRAWRAQSQGLPATVDPIMERAALAGEYARENPDDENVELGAELLAEEVLHPGIRSYNTEPDENGRGCSLPVLRLTPMRSSVLPVVNHCSPSCSTAGLPPIQSSLPPKPATNAP